MWNLSKKASCWRELGKSERGALWECALDELKMTRVSLNGSLGSPKAGVFCLRIRSIEGARERLESGYPMLRMRRNRLEIPMKHIEFQYTPDPPGQRCMRPAQHWFVRTQH